MEDEIINVNKTDFSMRNILGEDGWQIYQKASDKVRDLARIQVRMDLSTMEIGLARLNAISNSGR